MRAARSRLALARAVARRRVLAGAAPACGGSSVSDAVPKSTPDITPPNDTSAEKAAVQTTSTSTTTTSKTDTSTGESATGESESGKRSAPKNPRAAALRRRRRRKSSHALRRRLRRRKETRKIGRRIQPLRRRERPRPAVAADRSPRRSAASLRAWRSAWRCRSGARSGTGRSTAPAEPIGVCVRLRAGARALLLLAARAPRGVVAEAERQRGRPRRHGERDHVALFDGDRRFQRELRRFAEVRLQLHRRAGGDQLVGEVRLLLRAQDRDARLRRRRPRWR